MLPMAVTSPQMKGDAKMFPGTGDYTDPRYDITYEEWFNWHYGDIIPNEDIDCEDYEDYDDYDDYE